MRGPCAFGIGITADCDIPPGADFYWRICAPLFSPPINGRSRRPQPKWISIKWKFVCLLLTVVALFLVFRRIPATTLLDTIRAMRVGWFIGAVGDIWNHVSTCRAALASRVAGSTMPSSIHPLPSGFPSSAISFI